MQSTTNLQLSIYESNDVTSYLEVENSNMRKIDAGVGAVQTQVTANAQSIGTLQEDVTNLTPTVADANTKANASLTNTANVYDATQTYNVGDYCLYNNNLYRCITDITTAESFDGTKWVRVKTTDEIKTCNVGIDTCNQQISQINADLTNRGGVTLLATATADISNVNVSNMSQFKYIYAMINVGNAVFETAIIPYALFKTLGNVPVGVYHNTNERGLFTYVNDTTINLRVNVSDIRIYGIK